MKMPLKTSFVVASMKRQGWVQFNQGSDWVSLYWPENPHSGCSPYNVTAQIKGEHASQVVMATRHVNPGCLHHTYYHAAWAKADIDLMPEIARRLIRLRDRHDFNEKLPTAEEEQARRTAELMAEHDNQRIEAEWLGEPYDGATPYC